MNPIEAGTVIDRKVHELARQEGLTTRQEISREYTRLRDRVLDADEGLKKAYARVVPRVATTAPSDDRIRSVRTWLADGVGYARGLRGAELQAAMPALEAEVQRAPSFRRVYHMAQDVAGTIKRHATTTAPGAEGRKPIPASAAITDWERGAGFEGYCDAVCWAPIDVVVARHQHDEDVMRIRAEEVADYQRGHRGI